MPLFGGKKKQKSGKDPHKKKVKKTRVKKAKPKKSGRDPHARR